MSSATGRRVLGVMGVILGTILLVVVALFVYLRIREGRGAEAFQNGYGQYETWTSYAGFLIGALSILLGMHRRLGATLEAVASGRHLHREAHRGAQTRYMR
jgi:hypothetical protein